MLPRNTLYFLIALVLLLSACSGDATTPAPQSTAVGLAAAQPVASDTPDLPPTPLPPTPTPEPTSSPTPLPPPSILLEPKLYEIDIARLEQVPRDLLEQVYYYQPGMGGGSFGNFGDTAPGSQSQAPIWTSAYQGAVKPAVPTKLRWIVTLFTQSPAAEAWLNLPDGSKQNIELKNITGGQESIYEIVFSFAPPSPLGTYTLQVTQGSAVLQDTVTLQFPSEPTWTTYQDNLWYAGFLPSEPITLRVCEIVTLDPSNSAAFSEYSDLAKYVTEDNPSAWFFYGRVCQSVYVLAITADEYGAFQVHLPDGYSLSLHAEISGFDTTVPQCGESLPLRLKPGDTAQVTGYAEAESWTLDLLTRLTLTEGEQVTILFGPTCGYFLPSTKTNWQWVVQRADQTLLWAPESDAGGYYLDPLAP